METNLIPNRDIALDLWQRLSSSSKRQFEIILCSYGHRDNADVNVAGVLHLGYDVAVVKGDGWSIVGDFADGDWAKHFLQRLNQHGLFDPQSDAEDYLREYRQHKEADHDMEFEVVHVARVLG